MTFSELKSGMTLYAVNDSKHSNFNIYFLIFIKNINEAGVEYVDHTMVGTANYAVRRGHRAAVDWNSRANIFVEKTNLATESNLRFFIRGLFEIDEVEEEE